jgi:hypothetical protein
MVNVDDLPTRASCMDAAKTLEGKRVRVRGRIREIAWEFEAWAVSLGSVLGGAVCFFNRSREAQVPLKKGDRIILEGVCKGTVPWGGLHIEDCSISNNQSEHD